MSRAARAAKAAPPSDTNAGNQQLAKPAAVAAAPAAAAGIIRDRIRELRRVPARELKAHPKNWRKHPKAQQKAMAAALREIGYAGALLAREDADGRLVLIDGHLRAGITPDESVPVLVLDVDENEAEKILATHDPIAAMASFDIAELRTLVMGIDFEVPEFGELLNQVGRIEPDGAAAPDAQMDAAAELQAKWGTARGQIWDVPSKSTAGKSHRIACGDSSAEADVAGLFAGKESDVAALFATDPPYGVGYGQESGPESAKRFTAIAGDEPDGAKLQAFLESIFRVAIPHLRPDAAWYLWHAQLTQGFFAAAAAAQLLIHRQIIWAKKHFILGHGHFHWQHELCFYGWRDGHRARWFGDRSQTTLWEIPGERSGLHPTQKPTEIFTRPMQLNTEPGEICYEPFSGSGSQLCAAEIAGRICYAMEIEPKYVAVALERLSQMGLKPQLRGSQPAKRKRIRKS